MAEEKHPEFSPETLMAYADGQLSPEEIARVEQAIAESAELRREIADYRLTHRVVAQTLRPLDQLPVPPALVDFVLKHKGESEPPSAPVIKLADRRKARPVWIDAIAAGVLLSAGLAVGGTMFGRGLDQTTVLAMADNGALAPASMLATTLEDGASSVVRVRGGAQVRPVQTFLAGETPCREFEMLAGNAGSVGIACRRQEGWHIETLVAAQVTHDAGGFKLASGPQDAALETALANLDASAGLEAEAERCLITAGWSEVSSCALR